MRLSLCIFLFCAVAAASDPPRIDGSGDASRPIVSARLPEELARELNQGGFDVARARAILRLARIDETSGGQGPPVFGNYSLTGQILRFDPEFPLGNGTYRAVL